MFLLSAYGNCELPMAGAEKGYSGYPTFNAPEHLAVDLKELGVDIMPTANNNSLDKGFSGLASTLDFLELIYQLALKERER